MKKREKEYIEEEVKIEKKYTKVERKQKKGKRNLRDRCRKNDIKKEIKKKDNYRKRRGKHTGSLFQMPYLITLIFVRGSEKF